MSPIVRPDTTALDLAEALHAAGAPAHRVEEAGEQVAAAWGLKAQFFAGPTSLQASFAEPDGERTALAMSERLRDEVDITMVTTDLDQTVRSVMRPSTIGLWLREVRL